MSFPFHSVADDFFVNISLQTTLELPSARETLLHFCEAVQRQFPAMTAFYQRDRGEFVLEENREEGSYRWMEIQPHQLTGGFFNPPSAEAGYQLHRWLLDRVVYFLGISGMDAELLDVLFGFHLDYVGNRDQILAQALLAGSPLTPLVLEGPGAPLECEPNFVIALDENCYLQARLTTETRSSSYQVRTGQYGGDPISVYFTVRRFPEPGRMLNFRESFEEQIAHCEQLVTDHVIPNVIDPISQAISTAD